MGRVLVVEHNQTDALELKARVERAGHECVLAPDGDAALAEFQACPPSIVVLDALLPDRSGFEVLRLLRERDDHVPVLMLSRQKQDAAKVRAFRMGADDYVTKPYSMLELLARINALLRRATRIPPALTVVRFGDIAIDLESRVAYRAGHKVDISPKAFELLAAIVRKRGAAAHRDELLREVWGHRRAVSTRTVDLHMWELRNKLERDPRNPSYFITVRKFGYRLNTSLAS